MSRSLHLLLAGGLLAVLLGLLFPLSLRWLASPTRAWWKLSEVFRDYQANMRKQQELEYKIEVTVWRMKNQQQLTRELLDGRVSFLEVVASFQYLDENPPEEKAPPLPYAGATQEEKRCRQVINWVKGYMTTYPETRDEALLERLRQELAELLTRPGGVQLPPVASRVLR